MRLEVIMANKLYLIGIGPGSIDYIYQTAQKLIESSDVLIGGKRNLALFSHLCKEEIVIGCNLEIISRYMAPLFLTYEDCQLVH